MTQATPETHPKPGLEPSTGEPESQPSSWLEQPITRWIRTFDIEKIIFAVIIVLAVISRFYILGNRVMSHDEINHVIPSYQLYQGEGYRHDPVTHGPMQFHLIALSYTLFGDNDFTSRLPHALFSIATVILVWKFRRYLGRVGALMAALMMLISPYMLYYGRYARNEAFVALFALVTIYCMLRYLESPQQKYLLALAAVFSLQFCTKETAFIYTAQILVFLAILLFKRLLQAEWINPRNIRTFLIGILVGLVFFGGAIYVGGKINKAVATDTGSETATATLTATTTAAPLVAGNTNDPMKLLPIVLAGLGLIAFAVAAFFLVTGLGWETIRKERTFDLLMLIGSLILPQLTAFPVKFLGWNPLDYSPEGMIKTGIILVIFMVISAAIGLWWNPRVWWKAAAIFYAIYIFFYTTMFTNGQGFFTGIIGSLGYWLSQQGVNRGSQPLYFYALIQIPMYEFLPAIGAILALIYATRRWIFQDKEEVVTRYALGADFPKEASPLELDEQLPVWLLLYWSLTSLIAYSIAGEKMPWLTVHITWPMILVAGWAFGRQLTHIDWKNLWTPRGLAYLASSIILVLGIGRGIAAWNTTPLPFSGNQTDQLSATSSFIFAVIMALASLALIIYLERKPETKIHIGQMVGVAILGFVVVLTGRASFRASYILYDSAREYLVYAHAARGPKDILAQIQEISERMTGGKNLRIGYDAHSNYPYWWYFRDYTNLDFFSEQPSKAIQNDDIVVAGNPLYTKVDPILAKDFYSFEYVRLWWPNQDYFNLNWTRVKDAVTNPAIREGIFDIWMNRDYKKYAAATNSTSMTDITWEPAERMKLYIRKDLITKMWNYGAAPQVAQPVVDPYANGKITLPPDVSFGSQGSEPGQLDGPRGVAVAADNSIFVADSRNNRIQHFAPDGTLIGTWGTFADASKGEAKGGTFNEPWGVAVGPDGAVYVADTWNYRIQKFSPDGQFVSMWGTFGQGEKPGTLYGPRAIAVDKNGKIFVTDTGNKRVVVYNPDGSEFTTFGSSGMDDGQFDEPVGLVLDDTGRVYVADTWNQRIQVFSPDETGKTYTVSAIWPVSGWDGQSLENKPYIAVDSIGNVYITDPEEYRVIEFSNNGQFLRTWGDYSPDADGFGLSSGLAVDHNGGLWVSDGANGRLLHFLLQ
jgi:predicted membrane-bound mannosyltransferase/sugar lactone lactonase YvrE